MFFPECERLATEQPNLAREAVKVDEILRGMHESGGVLRIADVASKLRLRESVVSGIFDELVRMELLRRELYLDCPKCGSLEDRKEYEKAVSDGDSCECSNCGNDLSRDKPTEVEVFRVSVSAVQHSRRTEAEVGVSTSGDAPDGFREALPAWVKENPFKYTPLLNYYSKDRTLEKAQPFAGKRVLLLLHFLRDLIPFVEAMERLGLDMQNACFLYKEYPYPQREAVADWLRLKQATVLARTRLTYYLGQLAEAPSERIGELLVVEDGGHVVPALHNSFRVLLQHTLGAVEQTTRGIMNARAVAKLKLPVISVAESRIKNEIEPEYVADAVIRNVKRMLPNIMLQGKRAAVLGYGGIGAKVADLLRRSNALPTIFDPNEEKVAKARTEGFECAKTAAQAAQGRSFVIGTSGRPSVTSEVISCLDHGTYVVSASSELYEIDVDELHQQASREEPLLGDDGLAQIGTTYYLPPGDRAVYVLANGYPVNFWGSESMPEPIADLILSLILLSSAELALGRVTRHGVDAEVVNKIADRYEIARKFNEFQGRA